MSIDAARPARTITDPVVMYDSMWEAGSSLFGSLVWLSDHAGDPKTAQEWWSRAMHVHEERQAVSASDLDAQWSAMISFREREQALEPLIQL